VDRDAVLNQIDTLLSEFERVRQASPYDDFSGGVPDEDAHEIAIRLLAGVERLAPPGSPYVAEAREVKGHPGYLVQRLGAILKAYRQDVAAGFTESFAELVHGDIFEDFLAMAEELIGKGYEAAAAVLAGSVLEEHVGKLADKVNVPSMKPNGNRVSFDTVTVDLVKAQAISEPERKILVGWYGQRSEAAHGRPENLVSDQVARMPDGIREFIVRRPA
jgi:hypothetical protein